MRVQNPLEADIWLLLTAGYHLPSWSCRLMVSQLGSSPPVQVWWDGGVPLECYFVHLPRGADFTMREAIVDTDEPAVFGQLYLSDHPPSALLGHESPVPKHGDLDLHWNRLQDESILTQIRDPASTATVGDFEPGECLMFDADVLCTHESIRQPLVSEDWCEVLQWRLSRLLRVWTNRDPAWTLVYDLGKHCRQDVGKPTEGKWDCYWHADDDELEECRQIRTPSEADLRLASDCGPPNEHDDGESRIHTAVGV